MAKARWAYAWFCAYHVVTGSIDGVGNTMVYASFKLIETIEDVRTLEDAVLQLKKADLDKAGFPAKRRVVMVNYKREENADKMVDITPEPPSTGLRRVQ